MFPKWTNVEKIHFVKEYIRCIFNHEPGTFVLYFMLILIQAFGIATFCAERSVLNVLAERLHSGPDASCNTLDTTG